MFQDTSKRWTAISTGGYLYQTAQATLPASSTSWSKHRVRAEHVQLLLPAAAAPRPTWASGESADGNTLLIGGLQPLHVDPRPRTARSRPRPPGAAASLRSSSPWRTRSAPTSSPSPAARQRAWGKDGIAVASTAESGHRAGVRRVHDESRRELGGLDASHRGDKSLNALFTVNNAFLSPDGSHVWLLGQLGFRSGRLRELERRDDLRGRERGASPTPWARRTS